MIKVHVKKKLRGRHGNFVLGADFESSARHLVLFGSSGSGKTLTLSAIAGLVRPDEGHISIDGELLTTLSAPYFRRQMAYVPQGLTVPEGYDDVPTDYMRLLEHGVHTGKQLIIIDEPPTPLSEDDRMRRERMISEAAERGATVVAVNTSVTQNVVRL